MKRLLRWSLLLAAVHTQPGAVIALVIVAAAVGEWVARRTVPPTVPRTSGYEAN